MTGMSGMEGVSVEPLVPREMFAGSPGLAWLATAAESLPPRRALDAVATYVDARAAGSWGRAHLAELEERCRTTMATLLDVPADDVAFIGSVSEGINAALGTIDWQPGDSIVAPTQELEFPSSLLPARALHRKGVELRLVPHDGWVVTPAALAGAVDERTRAVVLSHVSWRTGHRFDLPVIAAAVRARNPATLLVVDATQSLGVVPVEAAVCDVVLATGCKWLLGPHGIAVMTWNTARLGAPQLSAVGWYSVVDDLADPATPKRGARPFALGGPNLPGMAMLAAGLDVLLGAGMARVARHALDLAGVLLAEMEPLGLEVITPPDETLRAGIVAWLDPHYRAAARSLEEQGIIVTGSAGRVRASFHVYNGAADVERLVRALGRR